MDSLKLYEPPKGKGCGKCCTNVIIPFLYRVSADQMRWYRMHNIEIKQGFMKINNKCENLDDNGWCKIYPTRPDVCRNYNCKKNKNMIFDKDRVCDIIEVKNG